MLTNDIVYYKNFLFFYREDIESGEKFLQIMHLPAPFNAVTNNTCIPVAAFDGNRLDTIAIDKVGNDKILRRWVVTLDGERIFPIVIGETKRVCFTTCYSNN